MKVDLPEEWFPMISTMGSPVCSPDVGARRKANRFDRGSIRSM